MRILGSGKLDLFSKSRFTKHCKWAADEFADTLILRFDPLQV
jgi:hypothetical protein